MTEYAWTLFGQGGGTSGTGGTPGPGTLAMEFTLSQDASLTGIWFYSPSGATDLPSQCGIYQVSSETLIVANESPTWSGDAASGWVKCTFDGTYQLFTGQAYKVAVYFASLDGQYPVSSLFWSTGTGASGLTNGIISAPNNADASPGQDSYSLTSGALSYPGSSGGGDMYWVDIEVTTGIPAATSPVPGFALASPRTWSAGDIVTTPRLRADMYNLAALTGQSRPLFEAETSQTNPDGGAAPGTVTLLGNNNSLMNSWNVILTQGAAPGFSSGPGTATFYPIPLPGWYLVQGYAGQTNTAGASTGSLYSWGMVYTQGTSSAAVRTDFGECSGPPSGTLPANSWLGNSGTELMPFNPVSGDSVGPYAYTDATNGASVMARWAVEWVGLPGSASINGVAYTGPVGTVVTTLKPATLWPPGPGGTLSAAIAAGGTALTTSLIPGLRAGQVIGLDWQAGSQQQAYAEVGTVSSIAGSTVNLAGTVTYAHSAGAPVAVPVSAALLNEQIRDQSNFWFYPPMLRAVQGTATAQSISSSTWTTVDLALTGSGITNTIDNFSGFASNEYTIPVSGLYLCAGQVYFNGSFASNAQWGARLIDNNGVTYSGDLQVSDSTSGPITNQSPAVRRLLRLTAGQTIALQAWQTSGSAQAMASLQTTRSGGQLLNPPRLICVMRAL